MRSNLATLEQSSAVGDVVWDVPGAAGLCNPAIVPKNEFHKKHIKPPGIPESVTMNTPINRAAMISYTP
jgi:hypothetical protein